jgi:TRAP-type transport system small permease protein
LPKTLRALEGALNLLERLFEWFVALLLIILLAIVSAQLIDRYLVDVPIAAPDQYARIVVVWLTFIGFAAALRAGTNVRVDLIEPRLPPKLRLALETAFDVLLLLLMLVITFNGWRLVEIGADQLLLGTPLSAAVPAAALVVACLIMIPLVALRLALRLSGRELPGSEER